MKRSERLGTNRAWNRAILNVCVCRIVTGGAKTVVCKAFFAQNPAQFMSGARLTPGATGRIWVAFSFAESTFILVKRISWLFFHQREKRNEKGLFIQHLQVTRTLTSLRSEALIRNIHFNMAIFSSRLFSSGMWRRVVWYIIIRRFRGRKTHSEGFYEKLVPTRLHEVILDETVMFILSLNNTNPTN
jgi:hypothetical protein